MFHNTSFGVNPKESFGRDVTYQRIKALFTWKGLSRDVKHFIRHCFTCQASKSDNATSPGLLHPLPIPTCLA